MTGVVSALLPVHAALDRLEVVERRLRIDREAPARSTRLGVPGSTIRVTGKHDLGSPSEARIQVGAEPLEEALPAGVPERIAGRVGAQADVVADSRTKHRVLPHGHWASAGKRPGGRGPGQSHRPGQIRDAQTGGSAPSLDLGANARLVVGSRSERSDQWPASSRHRRIVPSSPSLAVIRAGGGRCDGRDRAVWADRGSVSGPGRRGVRVAHGLTDQSAFGGRNAHVAHARPARRAT